MFAPGSIIVVTERPEVTYVTVRQNIGAIKNKGWLLWTEENNYILVSMADHAYLAKVIFIIDQPTLSKLREEVCD
jgi:hypothetical protein